MIVVTTSAMMLVPLVVLALVDAFKDAGVPFPYMEPPGLRSDWNQTAGETLASDHDESQLLPRRPGPA